MSSDFGALLLRGPDFQTGLIPRLVSAIHDKRHASYIAPLADLLRQRIVQSASGYADGNDANTLRRDPLFKLAVGRAPLDLWNDLASSTTLSRLENSVSRKDIHRLAKMVVDAFIASYAQAPAVIVLDRDHSEDATHGHRHQVAVYETFGLNLLNKARSRYFSYRRNAFNYPAMSYEASSLIFNPSALRISHENQSSRHFRQQPQGFGQ